MPNKNCNNSDTVYQRKQNKTKQKKINHVPFWLEFFETRVSSSTKCMWKSSAQQSSPPPALSIPLSLSPSLPIYLLNITYVSLQPAQTNYCCSCFRNWIFELNNWSSFVHPSIHPSIGQSVAERNLMTANQNQYNSLLQRAELILELRVNAQTVFKFI